MLEVMVSRYARRCLQKGNVPHCLAKDQQTQQAQGKAKKEAPKEKPESPDVQKHVF